MKTSLPTYRFSIAALLAVTAGLITGALWSSQPLPHPVIVVQNQDRFIDQNIPVITITAKRMSEAEKQRVVDEEIDPTIPHLTVIGYRDRTMASLRGMF